MADVRPLQGIRFSDQFVDDIAKVVTPPYDVISPEEQSRYYGVSPYNSIRLELGQEFSSDTEMNNRYTRASATYAEWREKGVLRQDPQPSYYLYQQVFRQGDQTFTRTSLLARVRLHPWSDRVVLPHEHTLSKPKQDRLSLLHACATNFSPIMCLYDDPQGRLRRLLSQYGEQAEVQITDEAGEHHRLHPITDPQEISQIQSFFAERQLYIADGHHRYETALAYRDEVRAVRKELDENDAVNFVMMALSDVDDPGLVVLPTHRQISNLTDQQLQRLSKEELGRFFTIKDLNAEPESSVLLDRLLQEGQTVPAFVLATPKNVWLLKLNAQGKAQMQQSGHSPAWNELDVAIAHRLVLEEMLGLSAEDLAAGTYVRYLRSEEQALAHLEEGEAQAVLLLNTTKVRQIGKIADASDQMPQKSTYFYPKLVTGLVLNPLW